MEVKGNLNIRNEVDIASGAITFNKNNKLGYFAVDLPDISYSGSIVTNYLNIFDQPTSGLPSFYLYNKSNGNVAFHAENAYYTCEMGNPGTGFTIKDSATGGPPFYQVDFLAVGANAYGVLSNIIQGGMTPSVAGYFYNTSTNYAMLGKDDCGLEVGGDIKWYSMRTQTGLLKSTSGLFGLASSTDIPFTDNSAGANWATTTPTTMDEAINRIAAVVSVGGTVPIP